MTCPNCSAINDDNAKICAECGTEFARTVDITEEKKAENLDIKEKLEAYTAVTTDFASVKQEEEENKVSEDDEQVACEVTDTVSGENESKEETHSEEISEDDSDTDVQESDAKTEAAVPAPSSKKNILKPVIVALSLLVVALVILAVSFGAKEDSSDYSSHPLVYTKDGQLMVRPDGKKESYKLCKSGNYYPYDGTLYSSTLQYTEDGDIIFFADDLSASIYDLYYRKTRDMSPKDGKKGTKIAKNVSMFQVVPEDKAVVYLTEDRLCYSDLYGEKEIAKAIKYFVVTEDGDMVFYEDDDGNIFICGLDDDDRPIKVDSEIQSFVTSIDDYEEMYYVKNDKLYFKSIDKKPKKVDSDIVNAFVIDDSVFTVKANIKSYTFEDLFTDDVSADAEGLVDPETLEEPDYENYEDKDAYARDYEAYKEEYLKLKEEWQEIDKKEEIQKAFEEIPFEITTYELYALKDNTSVKIADNLMTPDVEVSGDYGFFKKIIPFEVDKMAISNLESAEDARSILDEKANSALEETAFCVLTPSGKNYTAFTTGNDISSITVSDSGKYVYMLSGDNAEIDGDLIRYNISSSGLSKKKVVMKKVDSYTYYTDKLLTTLNDDREFMAVSSDKATLISENNVGSVYYIDGTLYFLDDYIDNSGNLTSYKKGKKKLLAGDVTTYRPFDENRIAYISDYDAKKDYGVLYTCNKNGKSKLVDKKVKSVF